MVRGLSQQQPAASVKPTVLECWLGFAILSSPTPTIPSSRDFNFIFITRKTRRIITIFINTLHPLSLRSVGAGFGRFERYCTSKLDQIVADHLICFWHFPELLPTGSAHERRPSPAPVGQPQPNTMGKLHTRRRPKWFSRSFSIIWWFVLVCIFFLFFFLGVSKLIALCN